MPRVSTSSSLCDQFTGGLRSFDVDAQNIGQLIRELDARFPGLGDCIDRRMAIAVDSEIFHDDWTRQLSADSEVYLVPRIAGGLGATPE